MEWLSLGIYHVVKVDRGWLDLRVCLVRDRERIRKHGPCISFTLVNDLKYFLSSVRFNS